MTSEDSGGVLENIVSAELRRRGNELFYFKQERECDLVAKKDSETLLVQVCWHPDKNNTDGELSEILEASKIIKADNLWKWLLADDTRA